MIKLIATDIDGTFLNSEWQPLKSTISAFEIAKEKGIILVPATGRVKNSLNHIKEKIGFADYVVTANGIGISTLDGEPIFNSIMPREMVDATVAVAKSLGIDGEVYIDGQAYASSEQFKMMEKIDIPETVKEYIKSTRKSTENFDQFVKDNYDKIEGMDVLALPRGIMQDLRLALSKIEGACPTSTSEWHIDIGYNGISKGYALKILGEKLGISTSEMMAFGDSENDIEMLKTVGIGVAMGNAMPEVKENADYVTDDNNSDGIYNAMKKFNVI